MDRRGFVKLLGALLPAGLVAKAASAVPAIAAPAIATEALASAGAVAAIKDQTDAVGYRGYGLDFDYVVPHSPDAVPVVTVRSVPSNPASLPATRDYPENWSDAVDWHPQGFARVQVEGYEHMNCYTDTPGEHAADPKGYARVGSRAGAGKMIHGRLRPWALPRVDSIR